MLAKSKKNQVGSNFGFKLEAIPEVFYCFSVRIGKSEVEELQKRAKKHFFRGVFTWKGMIR